jgi:hypothetical protein
MQEQTTFTLISSDLTFLTNEAGKTLRDRLGVLLEKINTQNLRASFSPAMPIRLIL